MLKMNNIFNFSYFLLLLTLTVGCSTENESFTPKLSVSNIIFTEGNPDGAAVLDLSIQKSASSAVTFD